MQPKIVVMLLLGTPGHQVFYFWPCIALRVGGLKGKKKCTKYWLGYVWGWVEWARFGIWWDIVWNSTAKICNHPHYDIVFVIVWTDFEQACKITLGQMNQNSGDVFHCNMLLLLFFREDCQYEYGLITWVLIWKLQIFTSKWLYKYSTIFYTMYKVMLGSGKPKHWYMEVPKFQFLWYKGCVTFFFHMFSYACHSITIALFLSDSDTEPESCLLQICEATQLVCRKTLNYYIFDVKILEYVIKQRFWDCYAGSR